MIMAKNGRLKTHGKEGTMARTMSATVKVNAPIGDYRCKHCFAPAMARKRSSYDSDPVLIVNVKHDLFCPIRLQKARFMEV
jgi:hypothetical protein